MPTPAHATRQPPRPAWRRRAGDHLTAEDRLPQPPDPAASRTSPPLVDAPRHRPGPSRGEPPAPPGPGAAPPASAPRRSAGVQPPSRDGTGPTRPGEEARSGRVRRGCDGQHLRHDLSAVPPSYGTVGSTYLSRRDPPAFGGRGPLRGRAAGGGWGGQVPPSVSLSPTRRPGRSTHPPATPEGAEEQDPPP